MKGTSKESKDTNGESNLKDANDQELIMRTLFSYLQLSFPNAYLGLIEVVQSEELLMAESKELQNWAYRLCIEEGWLIPLHTLSN